MQTAESERAPRRVVVVGTSGSGKTTLARALARRLGVPHVELDALHWEPDWTPAPADLLRERARAALAAVGWVTDGNYSMLRDLIWERADTLVWLDYPLPLILWRLARRILRRTTTREELWSGNRERLWVHFTRDSLILWALRTHPKHRRDYPAALAEPRHTHLRAIRLRSPRATARWLAALPNQEDRVPASR